METEISTFSPKQFSKRIQVHDAEMQYVDVGKQDAPPVVFLHGNPTSSYLWRAIIPPVLKAGYRCIAPDLVGMGLSSPMPNGMSGRFVEHARYLDEFFRKLSNSFQQQKITLVIHDWGSGLGFHWAYRHQWSVRAIVYMEALVAPYDSWEQWPDSAVKIFKLMRSPAGESIILDKNFFVERILPTSILRKFTKEEMDVYRKPYLEKGESRRPTLTWPREIPVEGNPKDVFSIMNTYSQWLKTSLVPKLFINADPGMILGGQHRDFVRTWSNQSEVTVKGLHFIQEDSSSEIATAIVSFLTALKNEEKLKMQNAKL